MAADYMFCWKQRKITSFKLCKTTAGGRMTIECCIKHALISRNIKTIDK